MKGNILNIGFSVNEKHFQAYVPDDQGFVGIKDVLLNREYEYLPKFELSNFKGKRILDVGAHVGLYSLLASAFAKEVIAIEPHPINYHLLRINMIRNDVKNVICVRKALWYQKENTFLFDANASSSYSLFPDIVSGLGHYVGTITLEEVVDCFGDIDLMKIDIEGAEFTIFEKLEKSILSRIHHIVFEVHPTAIENVKTLTQAFRSSHACIENFRTPIGKTFRTYPVSVDGLFMPKALRYLTLRVSNMFGIKDRNLSILFVSKR